LPPGQFLLGCWLLKHMAVVGAGYSVYGLINLDHEYMCPLDKDFTDLITGVLCQPRKATSALSV
jgi:hypothetical protein